MSNLLDKMMEHSQSVVDQSSDLRDSILALYGENKKIEDGAFDETCAVKCINGTFVGKRTDGILAFKGIPFVGAQPTGDLRWKAPVDYVADDGVYEAFYNGKTPNQTLDRSEAASMYPQGEDCLYLNVWKADDGIDKKPVMVWIHGGGYMMGGTADPTYECLNLVAENPEVIVVSIEYRLGVFGYIHLSHLPGGEDYPDSQNLGPMDQVQACKWVHENIAAFGGDPENVTIWGESAGSGSVTTMPLIEGAQKYFKKVIAHSGGLSITISTEEAIARTNELMDALGITTVDELKQVSIEDLLKASIVYGLRVGPERDGKFLPRDPYAAYASGAVKDITILHGFNKDEMDYFVHLMTPELFEMWAQDRKTKTMVSVPEEDKLLAESYRDSIDGEEYEKDSRLLSQLWFNASHIRIAEEQASAGGKSYVYYFTPEASVPYLHCGHATELAGIFNHPECADFTGRVFDLTFSKTMRKMWVQFAICGDPSLTDGASPDGKEHVWPVYDSEDKQMMVFDEFDIHVAKESDIHTVDWERTYPLTKYFYL